MKIHMHNIYMTHKIVYNLELIHQAVQEIKIWKKLKKILPWNISDIYRPIISPKELGAELSIIYLYKEFSRNRWTYKTHFFHFLIFTFLLITNVPW